MAFRANRTSAVVRWEWGWFEARSELCSWSFVRQRRFRSLFDIAPCIKRPFDFRRFRLPLIEGCAVLLLLVVVVLWLSNMDAVDGESAFPIPPPNRVNALCAKLFWKWIKVFTRLPWFPPSNPRVEVGLWYSVLISSKKANKFFSRSFFQVSGKCTFFIDPEWGRRYC